MYPLAKITKICVQYFANTSGIVGVFMKVCSLNCWKKIAFASTCSNCGEIRNETQGLIVGKRVVLIVSIPHIVVETDLFFQITCIDNNGLNIQTYCKFI